MSALGNLGSGNRDNLAGGRNAVSTSGGGFGSLTAWTGMGARMVDDVDAVKKRYARVKKAERPEWVSDQMGAIREQREARAFAALDELLER